MATRSTPSHSDEVFPDVNNDVRDEWEEEYDAWCARLDSLGEDYEGGEPWPGCWPKDYDEGDLPF